jgi:hypothetical protein
MPVGLPDAARALSLISVVMPNETSLAALRRGVVIPAVPLALNPQRRFDERRQRALMRYYVDAGAGGVAVGMHFTQFEIRLPGIDLFEPVLRVCAEAIDAQAQSSGRAVFKVAGIAGGTPDAVRQAELARELGYDFGIVAVANFKGCLEPQMLHHIREVAKVIPLFGFYIIFDTIGMPLTFRFWRELAEIEGIHAIKIAPFNRYYTIDVCRAIAEAGRENDITLYTGNDDSILTDLLTPFRFTVNGEQKTIRIRGGLLGQWACWTRRAVELLEDVHRIVESGAAIPPRMLTLAAEITDANAALFDAINAFKGSIPGVNEVLRRQGLLESIVTLKPNECLSPGQAEDMDRVCRDYAHLTDDDFVRENLDRWLSQ